MSRPVDPAAGQPSAPRVSVVIPTRNRPKDAAACVATILASDGYDELVVVDQSGDDATEVALRAVRDPRLRYLKSATRGATNGRNAGIAATRGDVIAFTDDDCRPSVDWVRSLAQVFASDPAAAVVCGRVVVPEALQQRGFAAAFEPTEREWQDRFPPPERDWGITANMAVRRAVFEQVGHFDPCLGPGAPMPCGEEPDLLFRVLKAGFKVVNAREVLVEHLGVRDHGPDAARVFKDYATGTAAALVKHMRLGDAAAAKLFSRHLAGCARLVFTNVIHAHRPVGIGYALAFARGALRSFRYRIDRKYRLYLPDRRGTS
jgi:GT2 family glycosyltransferase